MILEGARAVPTGTPPSSHTCRPSAGSSTTTPSRRPHLHPPEQGQCRGTVRCRLGGGSPPDLRKVRPDPAPATHILNQENHRCQEPDRGRRFRPSSVHRRHRPMEHPTASGVFVDGDGQEVGTASHTVRLRCADRDRGGGPAAESRLALHVHEVGSATTRPATSRPAATSTPPTGARLPGGDGPMPRQAEQHVGADGVLLAQVSTASSPWAKARPNPGPGPHDPRRPPTTTPATHRATPATGWPAPDREGSLRPKPRRTVRRSCAKHIMGTDKLDYREEKADLHLDAFKRPSHCGDSGPDRRPVRSAAALWFGRSDNRGDNPDHAAWQFHKFHDRASPITAFGRTSTTASEAACSISSSRSTR